MTVSRSKEMGDAVSEDSPTAGIRASPWTDRTDRSKSPGGGVCLLLQQPALGRQLRSLFEKLERIFFEDLIIAFRYNTPL